MVLSRIVLCFKVVLAGNPATILLFTLHPNSLLICWIRVKMYKNYLMGSLYRNEMILITPFIYII